MHANNYIYLSKKYFQTVKLYGCVVRTQSAYRSHTTLEDVSSASCRSLAAYFVFYISIVTNK